MYLLGGQGLAGVGELVAHLRATDLVERVRSGQSFVFAVDAGLAALGRNWTDDAGKVQDGLGLVDLTARATRGAAATAVTLPAAGLELPPLVGWLSHTSELAGSSTLEPLLQIAASRPGRDPSPDGVLAPGVIGTQLHGPVLALNPELADLVMIRALRLSGWPLLPVPIVEAARAQRIAELTAAGPGSRRRSNLLARLRTR